MLAKGRIKNISLNMDGGYSVMLDLDECRLEDIKAIQDEVLNVELKKYRAHRSLDANAYFHVLVGKIADAVGTSRANIKNKMIGRYGQPEIIDEKFSYITTQIEPEKLNEQEFLHTVCVNIKKLSDKTFYSYMIMRGSHTYNTKEMSTLIDGTVQEAKELGIETMTPEQLERMVNTWKG